MLLSEAVLTNQNVSLFILKWCRKQKSAFPAARAIFRLHWREREKKRDHENACDITFPICRESEEEEGDEKGRGRKDTDVKQRRGEQGRENGDKKEEMREKASKKERQSHLVCLISGHIIWLAGGKLLYQSPKGQSDFLNHFNKLEECDCPDSAAVSVLIRHTTLSELATHEPTKHITTNALLSAYIGKSST